MRGIFSLALGLLFTAPLAMAETTPLQSCLPNVDFSKTTLTCRIATVEGETLNTFTLTKGQALSVSDGKHTKSLNVTIVRALGPRLSDVGALDQSVEFVAKSFIGNYIATVDIPCNQTVFAAVGINKQGELPAEHIAGCSLNPKAQ